MLLSLRVSLPGWPAILGGLCSPPPAPVGQSHVRRSGAPQHSAWHHHWRGTGSFELHKTRRFLLCRVNKATGSSQDVLLQNLLCFCRLFKDGAVSRPLEGVKS